MSLSCQIFFEYFYLIFFIQFHVRRVRRKKRQVLKDKFSTQKLETVLVRYYYYLRMDFSISSKQFSLERSSMGYCLLSHTGFYVSMLISIPNFGVYVSMLISIYWIILPFTRFLYLPQAGSF